MLVYLGEMPNISHEKYDQRTHFLKTKQHGYIRYKQTYLIIAHEKIYIINAPLRFWEQEPSDDTIRYPQPGDTFHGKTRNKRCINHKIPFFYRKYVPLVVDEKNSIIDALFTFDAQ